MKLKITNYELKYYPPSEVDYNAISGDETTSLPFKGRVGVGSFDQPPSGVGAFD